MSFEESSRLGFRFHADGIETVDRQGRRFTVIGYLHSPEEFLVAEDTVDGSVWVFAVDLSTTWPLNTSRSALDACLAAFEQYFEDGPKNPGTAVFTAEEMRERLERHARGEFVARESSKPALSHGKRMRRLRNDVKMADRSALTRESWWSGVLEEAKNDLI